jgi:hypothetical protein
MYKRSELNFLVYLSCLKQMALASCILRAGLGRYVFGLLVVGEDGRLL